MPRRKNPARRGPNVPLPAHAKQKNKKTSQTAQKNPTSAPKPQLKRGVKATQASISQANILPSRLRTRDSQRQVIQPSSPHARLSKRPRRGKQTRGRSRRARAPRKDFLQSSHQSHAPYRTPPYASPRDEARVVGHLSDVLSSVITQEDTSNSFSGYSDSEKRAIIREIYRNFGHEPPDLEDMTSRNMSCNGSRGRSKSTNRQDSNAQTPKKSPVANPKPEHKAFTDGLRLRNVSWRPTSQEYGPPIDCQAISQIDYIPSDIHEERWHADLAKCQRSTEALFQHTIMMELLDRHRLHSCLDYSCEALWKSPRPPVRDRLNPGPKGVINDKIVLPYPRPDLHIGFKASSIIDEFKANELGWLYEHLSPEADEIADESRAFPFFIIEAKGSKGDVGDGTATKQCLNAASLALYNIWQFLKGLEEENDFFENQKIKVFTASGTGSYFRVRMHWPVRLGPNEGRIHDEYPVGYKFKTICELRGEQYTRAMATKWIKYVFNYGENELLSIIKNALPRVLERRKEESKKERAQYNMQKNGSLSISALPSEQVSQNGQPSEGQSRTSSKRRSDNDEPVHPIGTKRGRQDKNAVPTRKRTDDDA